MKRPVYVHAFLMILGFSFAGCASRPVMEAPSNLTGETHIDRGPAAATQQRISDALAMNPSVNTWMREQIRVITDNYFAASLELRRFDRTLERARNSSQVFGSFAYANLLSLRVKRIDTYQSLSELHEGLLDLSANGRGQAALTSLYETINEVQSTPDENPATEPTLMGADTARLALAELVEMFEEQRDAILESGDVSSSVREFLKFDAFAKLKTAPEVLTSIAASRRFNPEPGSPDRQLASKAMSSEAEEIHQEIVTMFDGEKNNRRPQAVEPRIFPSATAKGNITGNSFPKDAWALTFDDGPSTRHTPNVLANLRANNVKATFFVLAQSLRVLRTLAHAQRDQGHGLANHSYSHPQLTRLGTLGLEHEIKDSTTVQTEVWGQRPRFFRCPYGSGTNVPRIREVIAREKMIHVFWNVDSLDWQDRNPQTVFERTVKQMRLSRGGVILYHDIHAQSVIASELLMKHFNDKGLRSVTLSEIVDEINAAP